MPIRLRLTLMVAAVTIALVAIAWTLGPRALRGSLVDAIDEDLAAVGIPVSYTNVFWGGRSEIKPSEILPSEYEAWCTRMGVDPAAMRP